GFDSGEQAQARRVPTVPRVDLRALPPEVLGAQSAGVAGVLRVVRDAEVCPPALDRRLSHVRDRGATVAVDGVAVKASLKVVPRDERGERVQRGERKALLVLTQLRRHPRELESGVDILLIARLYPAAARVQPIGREFQLHAFRPRPQRLDVPVAAGCEPQRSYELLVRDAA